MTFASPHPTDDSTSSSQRIVAPSWNAEQTMQIAWDAQWATVLPTLPAPLAWGQDDFGTVRVPRIDRPYSPLTPSAQTEDRWDGATGLPVILLPASFQAWLKQATPANIRACVENPYRFGMVWGTHEYLAQRSGLTTDAHHQSDLSWCHGKLSDRLRTEDRATWSSPVAVPHHSIATQPTPGEPTHESDPHDGLQAEQQRLMDWLAEAPVLSPRLVMQIWRRVHPRWWHPALFHLAMAARSLDLSRPDMVDFAESLCLVVTSVLQSPNAPTRDRTHLNQVKAILAETTRAPLSKTLKEFESQWLDLLSGTPADIWSPRVVSAWSEPDRLHDRVLLLTPLCLGRDETRAVRLPSLVSSWRTLQGTARMLIAEGAAWCATTRGCSLKLPNDVTRRVLDAWMAVPQATRLVWVSSSLSQNFQSAAHCGRWRTHLTREVVGTGTAPGPRGEFLLSGVGIRPPQHPDDLAPRAPKSDAPDTLVWSVALGRSVEDLSPQRGAQVLRRHLARLHGPDALNRLLVLPQTRDVLGWTLAALPPATLAALGRPVWSLLLQHKTRDWRLFWVRRLAEMESPPDHTSAPSQTPLRRTYPSKR